jgi:hypothetical protein
MCHCVACTASALRIHAYPGAPGVPTLSQERRREDKVTPCPACTCSCLSSRPLPSLAARALDARRTRLACARLRCRTALGVSPGSHIYISLSVLRCQGKNMICVRSNLASTSGVHGSSGAGAAAYDTKCIIDAIPVGSECFLLAHTALSGHGNVRCGLAAALMRNCVHLAGTSEGTASNSGQRSGIASVGGTGIQSLLCGCAELRRGRRTRLLGLHVSQVMHSEEVPV